MELLLVLLVLLAAARLFGEIAVRLGQPTMVGELLAGIAVGVLASSILDSNGTFVVPRPIVDLSIFFLMLAAGLEMRPGELTASSWRALVVALGGVAVPLALGYGLGHVFLPPGPMKWVQCLFLGTALAITAVPVAIKMLMDIGRLHSAFGRTIVSAAIVDDVLGLVLLATLTAAINTGEMPDAGGVLLLIGQILLFVSVVVLLGVFVLPRLGRQFHRLRVPNAALGLLLVIALGYAVLAEVLGMHFILGAFAAGLFIDRGTVGARTYNRVKGHLGALSGAFLAPIFFASIGVRVDLSALVAIPLFTALLIVAALVGKLVGAGVPARLTGLGRRDAAMVGVGMSVRGAVELIVADIALNAGLFALPAPPPPIVTSLFSAVVVMALVTTLLPPVFLQALSRDAPQRPES